mgnify:CR=1 FL=1
MLNLDGSLGKCWSGKQLKSQLLNLECPARSLKRKRSACLLQRFVRRVQVFVGLCIKYPLQLPRPLYKNPILLLNSSSSISIDYTKSNLYPLSFRNNRTFILFKKVEQNSLLLQSKSLLLSCI